MAQELAQQGSREVAGSGNGAERAAVTFTPAVDIFEKGETTIIMADMPGTGPDDIDLTLERRVLTLTGRVKAQTPEGFRRVSSEYREGDYMRVFTLSDEVDQDKIKADFQNGVLRLELPRAAESKPKKISVKAA